MPSPSPGSCSRSSVSGCRPSALSQPFKIVKLMNSAKRLTFFAPLKTLSRLSFQTALVAAQAGSYDWS
jgi:hypothetical protein